MMNFLGKTLALVFATLALMAFAFALAIYFEFPDFGQIDPRRVVIDTETREGSVIFKYARVASAFDKTQAHLNEAYRMRDVALPPIEPQLKALRDAEARYPVNHLFYAKLIAELKGTGAGDPEIKVKALKDGFGNLDAKSPLAKPALDKDVPEISKTYAASVAELGALKTDILKVNEAIDAEIAKAKEITTTIAGFYDLTDREYKLMEKVKEEFEYLQPHWAESIRNARIFTERRVGLERTLDRLKKAE